MELILIRHATTQGNLERRFIGTTDLPILPEGADLARSVAPSLPTVDHIYISPLIRCRQTAELLWPHVPMTVVPELRETDFGPFEGKNHEELKDDPLYQAWISAPDPARIPVGESAEQVVARAGTGLRFLLHDATARGFDRVAAVSHGGTIMALLAAFGTPQRENLYDWMCPNCGGFLLEAALEPLTFRVLSPVGGPQA